MFENFKQDAARWIVPSQIGDPNQITLGVALKLLFRHMSLRALAWYRFGVWCRSRRIPFFFGFALRHVLHTYGLELSSETECGGGLYIAHPVGTVIMAHSIGRNVSVIAAVTVGMRNEWAFPDLGDNVFIGAGARVLGQINIGAGAVIGANAVVINDVPAGATAVGIPAKVIKSASEKE